MRLFKRMALLVKADAHGVMDHLEERTLLLKQHLREAELELTCKRARVEALEDEDRRLNQEVDRRRARVAALDQDVELALARGEEALARFSLRRTRIPWLLAPVQRLPAWRTFTTAAPSPGKRTPWLRRSRSGPIWRRSSSRAR